jgi:hypothetical protein
VPDIFDEVAEDLRAERTKRFFAKFGVYIVAGILLVVGAVGGFEAWQTYQSRGSAAVSDKFLANMRIADGPVSDRASAIPGFEAVAAEAGPGYRTLARLRAAALLADKGDVAGASAQWDQVANDNEADPLLRGLANLQWALHHVDIDADALAVAGRLEPLTLPNSPWRAFAQEAQAALDMKQGKQDAARNILKQLTQDTTAPDGVRGRANGLLARLGG